MTVTWIWGDISIVLPIHSPHVYSLCTHTQTYMCTHYHILYKHLLSHSHVQCTCFGECSKWGALNGFSAFNLNQRWQCLLSVCSKVLLRSPCKAFQAQISDALSNSRVWWLFSLLNLWSGGLFGVGFYIQVGAHTCILTLVIAYYSKHCSENDEIYMRQSQSYFNPSRYYASFV